MEKNTCLLNFSSKDEREALIKMYPNEDIKDKYILFVESELWFPFAVESLRGNVEFVYEDDIQKYKTRLRHPYPNKTITTISMLNGRKVCDLGIPIIFSSYKELKKLRSLVIKWEIDLLNDNNINEKYYIHILYNIDFKYVEGKYIYRIHSKDTILQSYTDSSLLDKYIEEFSKVIFIKNYAENEFCVEYFKGEETDPELMQEEGFVTIIDNLGMKTFIDVINSNKNFKIFSYYSDEMIEPNI